MTNRTRLGHPHRHRHQHGRHRHPRGRVPDAIAITPDGQTAYVATTGNTVIPIATATNTAGTPIALGTAPSAIAITPDGQTALWPIRVTARSPPSLGHRHGRDPDHRRERPRGHRHHPRRCHRLCGRPGQLGHPDRPQLPTRRRPPISVGSSPGSIAITPDGTTAYVANNSATGHPDRPQYRHGGQPDQAGNGPKRWPSAPTARPPMWSTPKATR